MALDVTDNPATHAAGDVLNRKYGPLPFWAWLILVCGVAYGVRRYQQRTSVVSAQATADAATLAVNTPTDGTDATPTGGGYTTGVGNIAGTYGGQVQNPTNASVTSAYTTNAAWIVGATSVLVGMGNYNAFAINSALTKYCNGVSLANDPQSVTIVGQAIAAVGAPPEGVPVQTPTPVAATPVPVKPGGNLIITAQESAPGIKHVGDMQTITVYAKDSAGHPVADTLNVEGSPDNGKTWQIYGKLGLKNGSATYRAKVGTKGAHLTRFSTGPNDIWKGSSNVISEVVK